MLHFRIVNMSCGHCQLKVSSTLNEAGYDVMDVNMDSGVLKAEGHKENQHHIVQLLDQIGYMVDQDSFVFLEQHIISSDKFDDEDQFDQFLDYLAKKSYEIQGINDDLSIVLYCSDKDLHEMIKYLEML
ncbi:MAG: heavy-metal-associated domain-containing protein [Candidatus Izemoplasmataceae bacterium]